MQLGISNNNAVSWRHFQQMMFLEDKDVLNRSKSVDYGVDQSSPPLDMMVITKLML